tara:strand:- start:821 stop:1030 length:210 start_codon:yes stop_codon:yes gene_type:complete
MAKPIMISNELYEQLKKMKKDRSFTNLIKSKIQPKTNSDSILKKFYGKIPNFNDTYLKKLDKEWEKWTI